MSRVSKYAYGPSLTETLEVGDVFRARSDGRIFSIVGKIYNDDLSLSYRTVSTGSRPRSIIHEKTFKRSSGGYVRIYKVPRRILQAEVTFTGVFYGRS